MQQRFTSPALCSGFVEVGCQAGPEIGLVGRIPFIQGVVRCPGRFFIAPGGQCSILPMGAPTDVGQDSQAGTDVLGTEHGKIRVRKRNRDHGPPVESVGGIPSAGEVDEQGTAVVQCEFRRCVV